MMQANSVMFSHSSYSPDLWLNFQGVQFASSQTVPRICARWWCITWRVATISYHSWKAVGLKLYPSCMAFIFTGESSPEKRVLGKKEKHWKTYCRCLGIAFCSILAVCHQFVATKWGARPHQGYMFINHQFWGFMLHRTDHESFQTFCGWLHVQRAGHVSKTSTSHFTGGGEVVTRWREFWGRFR